MSGMKVFEMPAGAAEFTPELLGMLSKLQHLAQETAAGKTFVAVEGPILDICRQMGQWALERAVRSHPLAEPEQEHRCPDCGGRLRILRHAQRREIKSRLGAISYNRPYGTCDRCKRSGAPMDWELGLSPDVAVSIGVLERGCHASVVARAFSAASEIMKVHGEVDLSAKYIRTLAEGEGRKLVLERGRQVAAYREEKLAVTPEKGPPLIVVCADGGRVQTRQDDASKRWKEDKIGVVYEGVVQPPESGDREKYRGAKAKVKTYVASMVPWESFGWMLRLEAENRGYTKAREKVFLSDGAESIHELQKFHFEDATRILDWAHAAEHVSACAKAAFGEGTDKAGIWYLEHRQMLWDGKTDDLILDIQKLADRAGAPRKDDADGSIRKVLNQNAYSYFPNNKKAIDYPTFRAKGWPIGSGVAESGVKQIGLRMKGSEKFWNGLDEDAQEQDPRRTGAEEMLALCCLYESEDGRWQKHWEQRAQPIRWK